MRRALLAPPITETKLGKPSDVEGNLAGPVSDALRRERVPVSVSWSMGIKLQPSSVRPFVGVANTSSEGKSRPLHRCPGAYWLVSAVATCTGDGTATPIGVRRGRMTATEVKGGARVFFERSKKASTRF